MRKILLLFVSLFLCVGITDAQNENFVSESDVYSSIKTIVQNHPEKYKKLLQRFCNVDADLTLEELKTIYYGYTFTSDYEPYERYNEINNALRNEDSAKALLLCERYLAKSPVSLYLLIVARDCAMNTGDFPLMSKYHTRYHQLLKVITATGTGKDKENAYKVIRIPDETEVLRMAHQMEEKVSQQLVDGNYDVITIKSSNKESDVYFDVSRMFERLKEQMKK